MMMEMEYDGAAPREWIGTGNQQAVSGHRQQVAEAGFEQRVQYAVKSNTHLWVVALIHYATDQMIDAFLDADDANMPILDADTLAQRPSVLCWLCNQPLDSRQKFRKCPGELK